METKQVACLRLKRATSFHRLQRAASKHWLRPRVFFWLLWSTLSLLSVSLIWGIKYPPFIDAGSVAYSAVAYHDLEIGSTLFGRWHALRPHAVSHSAFYTAYHWLLYVFPPLPAMKLLVTGAVLALPAAMLWLVRAMNRSDWVSLAGFGLAFNTNLNMGFLAFVAGLPLFPVALGLVELNSREFRFRRALTLWAILVGSACVHLFLTAVLFPSVCLWIILSPGRRRRVGAQSMVLASAALAVWLWVGSGTVSSSLSEAVKFAPLAERWDQLDREMLVWTLNGFDALSFPMLLVALVASLILSKSQDSTEPPLRRYRAAWLALALLLAYLFGPHHVLWPEVAWSVGTRIAAPLALCLPLMADLTAVGWRAAVHAAPWWLFSLFHLVSLLGPFHAYDRETAPVAQLLERLPQGSRMLTVYGSEWMRDEARYAFGGFQGFVFAHAAKWAAAETSSYQPDSFCAASYHPISCVQSLEAPPGRDPLSISTGIVLQYDRILALENTSKVLPKLQSLPLRLQARVGHWSLWRVERRHSAPN